MRTIKTLCLLSLTLLPYQYSQAGTSSITTGTTPVVNPKPQTSNGLKLGAWTFTYYAGPNQKNSSSTSKLICISAKNWTGPSNVLTPVPKSTSSAIVALPYIPAEGEWVLDKGTYLFYGNQGFAVQGGAFSAFAEQINDSLLTGHYVNFNIYGSNTAKANYGTFKAVYSSAICPVY